MLKRQQVNHTSKETLTSLKKTYVVSKETALSYLISVVYICHASCFLVTTSLMPPRSSRGSFSPPNDTATYKDLLLFEERLKINAASLQRRKSRYQCVLLYFVRLFVTTSISPL